MVERRILTRTLKKTEFKPRDVQRNVRVKGETLTESLMSVRVMKRDEVTGINEGNNGKD